MCSIPRATARRPEAPSSTQYQKQRKCSMRSFLLGGERRKIYFLAPQKFGMTCEFRGLCSSSFISFVAYCALLRVGRQHPVAHSMKSKGSAQGDFFLGGKRRKICFFTSAEVCMTFEIRGLCSSSFISFVAYCALLRVGRQHPVAHSIKNKGSAQ